MRYVFRAILLLFSLIGGVYLSQAQTSTLANSQALFIGQFIKYIQWPSQSITSEHAPKIFSIGVLGETDVYPVLQESMAKNLILFDNTPQLMKYETADELGLEGQVHIYDDILFISKSAKIDSKQLRFLSENNVLLIGESEDFFEKGGLINFTIQRNQPKFQINQNALIEHGFKIDPRLLKLALLSR